MLFIFYKLSGDYFVAFIGADWWFWNYEILQFNVFVKGGWGLDVKFWTFAGGGFTKMELVQKKGKGSKFWSFCDNVIIEWPHTKGMVAFPIQIKIDVSIGLLYPEDINSPFFKWKRYRLWHVTKFRRFCRIHQ